MVRDDEDDIGESAARRLERGNKSSPDEAKKQLLQQVKKQERITKMTKLQLQVAKQNEAKPEQGKTKTREEEVKEQQQGAAQKKESIEDKVKQEQQEEAAKQASPFEYQQDAG